MPLCFLPFFSFNPRICKRCDMSVLIITPLLLCFNPRICKRCDSSYLKLYCYADCFNPRICKRCDCKPALNSILIFVSIHASVKDATKRQKRAIAAQKVSIHASVKDATVSGCCNFIPRGVSIHASVKDATHLWQRQLRFWRFQSTHL